ncbi:MAG TPA: Flp family type IVb pilin [Tepidiformaceae bacterium]|nr:Flp family type IVb pilin [Tepidiformaceae bacterium]
MTKIKNWAINKMVERQIAKEEGQGLAEYGLILALIAVVCIIALTALGGGISDTLDSLTSEL